MYRPFPRILMCLLSVPLSMRLRLSFSRILSILRSSADISGLIAIPDDKELLHDRTRVASKALRNLTRMGQGRVLF